MTQNVTDLILLTPTEQMKTYAKTELDLLENEGCDPLEFAKTHHKASVQMVRFRSTLDHLQITELRLMQAVWGLLSYDEIRELWKPDPWCSSDEFGYDFEGYACAVHGLDWSTLDNYCRVAKTFLTGETELEIPRAVPKHNLDTGELIQVVDAETGEITEEAVEFDPWETPLGKLQLAVVPARTGELDETGVELLARNENGGASWRDVLRYLRGGQTPWDDGPAQYDSRRFYVDSGLLYYVRTGLPPTPLMPFGLEDGDNPIAAEGFQELMERAGIRWGAGT